uniref:GTP-binding protein 1 (Trinotate prediction) n=1 Tax=Myxobolus squamalis TaxID=59785 RepID=A0A6B2G061_MYXSQ
MTQNDCISSTDAKILFNLNRKIHLNESIFVNKEEYHIFENRICKIFVIDTITQIFIEICAIEKLNDILCKSIVDELEKITPDDSVDISFIISFIRNDVTVLTFMGRRKAKSNCFFEIRMATAGNVDAGKSTLLGVLTHNIRDDGRGFARSKMFRHQHELESGRTSSIGESTVAVDSRGKIILKSKYALNKDDIDAYTSRAHKMFDFLDLAGHEKYLKTTIYGLVGLKPDYIMLVIGSNMGLIGMARG